MDEPGPAPVRGRKPARGEPVVERTLRLLSAFRHPEEALSPTSLAARTGLSQSTALRLARHLLDCSALERSDTGEFVVGLRLLEVASLAPRGHGLRATAIVGADRTDPLELRRRIAAIRREGSATNSRTVPDRMSSAAAPVVGADGEVVAALSVIAPTDGFDPATARPAVIAIARAVSRALRGQRSDPDTGN